MCNQARVNDFIGLFVVLYLGNNRGARTGVLRQGECGKRPLQGLHKVEDIRLLGGEAFALV